MLKSSGITRDEVLANPDDVKKVLEFQNNYQHNSTIEQKSAPAPMPEEITLTLDQLVSKEDPTAVFKDMKKIGEG